jgi:hypothetical protein
MSEAMRPEPAMALIAPVCGWARLWRVFRAGSLRAVFDSGGHPSLFIHIMHTVLGEPQ